MDSLCLKAGIHGMPPPIAVAGVGSLEVRKSNPSHISAATVGRASTGISVEKPSISSPQTNSPWGFTFRYPLRSLWPRGGKNRYGAAISVEDAVPGDVKKEKENDVNDEQTENWVFKILHVRSMWKQNDGDVQINEGVEEQSEISIHEEQSRECTTCDAECDLCTTNDDNDEKANFDRDSFSKLLQKVSLPEARLFARLSYLGTLAYSIPQIKVMPNTSMAITMEWIRRTSILQELFRSIHGDLFFFPLQLKLFSSWLQLLTLVRKGSPFFFLEFLHQRDFLP